MDKTLYTFEMPCNALLRGKEGFSWGYKGELRGRIGERFKSSENTRYNHLFINHPERGKTNIPRGAKRTYRERTCTPIKNAFVAYVR